MLYDSLALWSWQLVHILKEHVLFIIGDCIAMLNGCMLKDRLWIQGTGLHIQCSYTQKTFWVWKFNLEHHVYVIMCLLKSGKQVQHLLSLSPKFCLLSFIFHQLLSVAIRPQFPPNFVIRQMATRWFHCSGTSQDIVHSFPVHSRALCLKYAIVIFYHIFTRLSFVKLFRNMHFMIICRALKAWFKTQAGFN